MSNKLLNKLGIRLITVHMMVWFIRLGAIIRKDNLLMENHRLMEMLVELIITFSIDIHLESIIKSTLTMDIDTLDKKIKDQLRETKSQSLQLPHQQMSHQLQEKKRNLINQLALKRKLLQKKFKRKTLLDLKLQKLKQRSHHLQKMPYLRLKNLKNLKRSQLSHSWEMTQMLSHQNHGFIRLLKTIFLMGHTLNLSKLKSTSIMMTKPTRPLLASTDLITLTVLLVEVLIYLMFLTIAQESTTTDTDYKK